MARTTVRLYTTFRGRLVKEDGEFEADSIRQLLEALGRKYGQDFLREIWDGKQIKNYYIVLHNGQVVDRQMPNDVPLTASPTMALAPYLALVERFT